MMIDTVGKLFVEMKSRKLVSSMAEFSRTWLSKGEDHFAGRYNKVAVKTKLSLYFNLRAAGHADLAGIVLAMLATDIGAAI
jgi:hypothetical protein